MTQVLWFLNLMFTSTAVTSFTCTSRKQFLPSPATIGLTRRWISNKSVVNSALEQILNNTEQVLTNRTSVGPPNDNSMVLEILKEVRVKLAASGVSNESENSRDTSVDDADTNVRTAPALDVLQELSVQMRKSTGQPNINAAAAVDGSDVRQNYGLNPTITNTALAHSLWSHVVRTDIDTVIDATAGNGADAVVLADLLFSGKPEPNLQAELIAIDIQNVACSNTESALQKALPSDVFANNVRIVEASHSPLPLPRYASSVALVVYNLGFLPSAENKTTMTSTNTTVASLADASLMLRLGGMLSVMTYPRTNTEEAYAVHAFLEGLALFSSKSISWEDYVAELTCSDDVKARLLVTLRHVLDQGSAKQTWRVNEHKKLGWIDAPILLTATRIK